MKKKELNALEALYGFCGWLTTRKKKTIMSSTTNCSEIVELILKFQKANNLGDCRDGWHENLVHPKE